MRDPAPHLRAHGPHRARHLVAPVTDARAPTPAPPPPRPQASCRPPAAAPCARGAPRRGCSSPRRRGRPMDWLPGWRPPARTWMPWMPPTAPQRRPAAPSCPCTACTPPQTWSTCATPTPRAWRPWAAWRSPPTRCVGRRAGGAASLAPPTAAGKLPASMHPQQEGGRGGLLGPANSSGEAACPHAPTGHLRRAAGQRPLPF